MKRLRLLFFPIVLLVVADLLLWLAPWPVMRTVGALLLLALLPGWTAAALLLGVPRHAGAWLLTLLTALAAGFGILSVVMLLLVYLPGGVSRSATLATFHFVAFAGMAALALWGRPVQEPPETTVDAPLPNAFWWALLIVLVVAASLRLVWLGYSEFQGDEARVLLRAQDALAGFENPLFIHHKTPGEILIAAGILSAAGATGEAAARLPFALAALATVAATLLLGWRLFGGMAGVTAALLLATDGYAVAFGRIVQYQSVVMLASVFVVLLLWRETQRAQDHPSWRALLLAALIALGGFLAHYDLLAVGLPVVWLLWSMARRFGWLPTGKALLPALLVGAGGAALFLVPWLRHPGFGMALDYVVGERMGTQPPYDNLYDFARRTAAYSSIYPLLLVTTVTLADAVILLARQWGGRAAAAIALLLAGTAVALWLVTGSPLYAALLLAAALVVVALLPRLSLEERTVWLWFAPLAALTLFAVQQPDTHVYIFFLPWFLVAGAALHRLWIWLHRSLPAGVNTSHTYLLRWGFVIAGALLMLLFWGWTWQIFADAPAERYRQWTTAQPVGYWFPFDAPPERANMGFPLRNGWKSVGVLYNQGALADGFETNAKPEVVDWYTRGAGACPDTPVRFLLAETVETADDTHLAALRADLASRHAQEGVVTVGGVDRLLAFAYEELPAWRAADEDAVARFDALAAQQPIARRGNVLDWPTAPTIDIPLGDGIVLRGYAVRGADSSAAGNADNNADNNADDTVRARPGDTLHYDLFWESTGIVATPYTVFLQLIDPATNAKAGQTDALPVCGQHDTNLWRPGDRIVDPQRITLFPDATPGEYNLYAGMYDVNTGQRLPIALPDGASADWYALATVRVE